MQKLIIFYCFGHQKFAIFRYKTCWTKYCSSVCNSHEPCKLPTPSNTVQHRPALITSLKPDSYQRPNVRSDRDKSKSRILPRRSYRNHQKQTNLVAISLIFIRSLEEGTISFFDCTLIKVASVLIQQDIALKIITKKRWSSIHRIKRSSFMFLFECWPRPFDR